MTQRVRAVVFDIGETLVDETRHWASVATYAGVPELTLMGVLGGLIERREHHRSLFAYLQTESVDPNVFGYAIEPQDLYPDVVDTLRSLKTAGYRLGITGNQPSGAIDQTRALGLPVEFYGSSADWGVAKPDPSFFANIASGLDLEFDQIAYVVIASITTCFLRRNWACTLSSCNADRGVSCSPPGQNERLSSITS